MLKKLYLSVAVFIVFAVSLMGGSQAEAAYVYTSAGAGGAISPSSGQFGIYALSGSTKTFTVTPNSAYYIQSVSGCGGTPYTGTMNSINAITYTTGAITSNCTVTAAFAPITYALTVNVSTSGGSGVSGVTVTYNGQSSGSCTTNTAGTCVINGLQSGDYTVTPSKTGYTFSGINVLTITSADVQRNFTATPVHTISGQVTRSVGGGLSLGVSGVTISAGNGISATTDVSGNYTVSNIPSTAFPITITPSKSGWTFTPATRTLNNAQNYSSTNFTATINSYTVTPSSGAGGSISPATAQTVNYNSTTLFTVTPDTGFTIGSVSGCNGVLSGSTYTTGAITSDCSVSATFIQATVNTATYTVATSAGTGGSISPANATVNSGSTQTFTIAPNTGYSIDTVSGCNGSLSGNTYTTGAITAPCTVTASFTADSNSNTNSTTGNHSLNVVKLGTGSGVVTGTGIDCGSGCSGSYAADAQVTLMAIPSSGSSFAGWSGGGCSGTGACTVTLNTELSIIAVFTMPSNAQVSTDNCKASVSMQDSNYHLNTPIIEFVSSGLLPNYYWADFMYIPTPDGLLWFKAAGAGALTDTTSFINCQATILSQNTADYYVFVPRLVLANASYWLLLQYVPGEGNDLMFKTVNYGSN